MEEWKLFCTEIIDKQLRTGKIQLSELHSCSFNSDGLRLNGKPDVSKVQGISDGFRTKAKNSTVDAIFEQYKVYANSVNKVEDSYFFIAWDKGVKSLIIYNTSNIHDEFEGRSEVISGIPVKVCDLNIRNASALRKIFSFTKPSNFSGAKITIGLGDRLGLASPGHIRLIRDLPVFPVLAQQSVRELNLTGRTYEDVLAAASWAVFQEGYKSGFGADGDHLKTPDEVNMALECGFTMITLDCSEYIDNKAAELHDSEIDRLYKLLPENRRERFEEKYLRKEFNLNDGTKISFSTENLKRVALIYSKAIDFAIDIYRNAISKSGKDIDFEMSIDETLTPTTPESHFFVASELIDSGVEITSLAPRFCGEFQKGIDYKGDIEQFEKEFTVHCKIAEYFGYKISVHSGSDKFTVFPIIGRITKGRYHLKTAGTNWLEAVRVIAAESPDLYRKIHKFAAANLNEAKKYYHISTNREDVPDVDLLRDEQLPELMNDAGARQALHVTFGLILQAKNSDGSYMFRDEFFDTLNKNEGKYYEALIKHIGRHLEALGIKSSDFDSF